MRKRKTSPSQKELAILEFCIQYWRENFRSPTTREIADQFNTSTSYVSYCLDSLKDFGLIYKENSIARGIVPMEIVKLLERGGDENGK